MKNLLLILLALGGMLLTGCERRAKDEPQREPGTYFRTGGDVVINGGK